MAKQRTVLRGCLAAAAALVASTVVQPALAQQTEPAKLSISLADAVRLAFDNNLDIRVVGYDRTASREQVTTARGRFEPVFTVGVPGVSQINPFPGGGAFGGGSGFGGLGFSDVRTPSSSALAGASTLTTRSFATFFDLHKTLQSGTRVDFSYTVGRSTTNSIFQSLNPAWDNTLALSVVQPLLRGRGHEAAAAELLLARADTRVSEERFRAQVEQVLLQVEQAYWQLVFAERDLQVKESSLQLAREQLERTRAQVEVGLIAPVQVTQAEVQIATRETERIQARNALEDARDQLRALLRAESLPAGWDTQLEPTDAPEFEPHPVDLAAAIQKALEHRAEIRQGHSSIQARRIQVDASRDALLPQVDLLAQVSTNGIGGDLLVRDGFPGQVVDVVPGGYRDALDQLTGLDFISWRLGVNVSLPIGNSAAKGSYAQATIAEDQARADLERTRQQVVLEVRRAARALTAAAEAAQSARKTRELAERQLEIETDRFEVGMTTNFEVLQFQDDLAVARSAELRALIQYRLAEAELERASGGLLDDYGIRIQTSPAVAPDETAR